MAPAADPNSRTFLIKLDLPRESPLQTGQFARALIPAGRKQALIVPENAIVRRGQLEFVYVIQKDKAHLRLVRTGRRAEGGITLLSGLDAGENIAIENAATLMDGQPVVAP